ncbi:zinc-ribbon domain-containing protein [Nisaea sp.]|uniref:zinc-ribbon domain-containing protein n=1 Tax=Nisaea sp. TaxID=2024842 RepID=UPI003B516A64
MKVNCPECSQHFSVPDKAIGPKGRKLRCSKCGHQWHQMLEAEEPPKKKKAAPKQVEQPVAKEIEPPPPEEEEEEEVVPFARFGSGEADPDAPPAFEEEDGEEREGAFSAPPIPRGRMPLSGKPKRKRKGLIAAAAGVVLVAGLGTLFGARAALVGTWPPIDRLYQSVGLGVPVIGEGLVIQNVGAWRKAEGSIELLLVKGEIRNPTEQLQTVPTLSGKLTGRQGDIMQEWLFQAENQVILPGEKTTFQYELPQPGADAAEVTVTFSERALGGGLGY